MKIRFMILVLFVTLLPTVVRATDGSLKIDTNLQTPTEQRDVFYIEQETSLAKLFSPEVTNKIDIMQTKELEGYTEEKNSIFMMDIKKENLVEAYQILLFTPETMVSTKTNHTITLNERTKPITWQMVLILLVGLIVMGISIYNLTRKNKGKANG